MELSFCPFKKFYNTLDLAIANFKFKHTGRYISALISVDCLFSDKDEYRDLMFCKALNTAMASFGIESFITQVSFNSFLVLWSENSIKSKFSNAIAKNIFNRINFNLTKLRSKSIYLMIMIGYSIIEQEHIFITDIMRRCNISINECRTKNKSFHYYNTCGDKHNKIFKLVTSLEDAISSKKIKLFFQPIVEANTNTVTMHEALLRVPLSGKKTIPIDSYILAAEKLNYIEQVDLEVLKLACKELSCNLNLRLGINISNKSIENYEWLANAKTILSYYDDVASRLVVEITETAFHKNIQDIKKFASYIRNIGCKIAIDDFGSGSTSFFLLNNIKVDFIKIDGLYTRNVVKNKTSCAFITAMVKLAKMLGVKVIAEFVEDKQIACKLSKLKVDYLQGNYFAPASPFYSNHY